MSGGWSLPESSVFEYSCTCTWVSTWVQLVNINDVSLQQIRHILLHLHLLKAFMVFLLSRCYGKKKHFIERLLLDSRKHNSVFCEHFFLLADTSLPEPF